MGIIIGVVVSIGFICFLSMLKMLRRNKDPKQQELALMFIAASHADLQEIGQMAAEIGSYIADKGWDRVKAAPRIAHALSMVRVLQPAAYLTAIEVSRRDELWEKIRGGSNPMPHSN
jgi:hypothetical protein